MPNPKPKLCDPECREIDTGLDDVSIYGDFVVGQQASVSFGSSNGGFNTDTAIEVETPRVEKNLIVVGVKVKLKDDDDKDTQEGGRFVRVRQAGLVGYSDKEIFFVYKDCKAHAHPKLAKKKAAS
jgi:hypothetical protein